MKYPKFIITEDGHFRLGMVNRHENLLMAGDFCIGGGYYQIDHSSKCIILEGESCDYGPPLWNKISSLIVAPRYRDMQIIYQYNDDLHEDLVITDEKEIKYGS